MRSLRTGGWVIVASKHSTRTFAHGFAVVLRESGHCRTDSELFRWTARSKTGKPVDGSETPLEATAVDEYGQLFW